MKSSSAMQERMKARMERLRQQQTKLRASTKSRPPKKGAGSPGGWRHRDSGWALLVAVLLLLLFLRGCEDPPEEALPCIPEPKVAEPVVVEPVVPDFTGRIPPRPRPAFQGSSPPTLDWLASFRMQVAARSPRLADCFVGVGRPGTLKWSVLVEPADGRVSEHSLEPTLLTDALSEKQRACVIEVLSSPSYKLVVDAQRATPSRVGMVIEF